SADQFSAQLDEVIIFGTFTQFVVEDNEHVEMIVSDEDYNGLHAKKVIVSLISTMKDEGFDFYPILEKVQAYEKARIESQSK
ncbi:MAG: hypothetical protein KH152_09300, partial [Finegoldia magna]|nr:hypothetical protein [Finegoldia magna]